MKKFLNIFFVTLGVIFFLLLLVTAYFYITDPLNLKPLLLESSETKTIREGDSTATPSNKHPLLSESQEQTLETFGIDSSDLPTEISPEQEQCFENAIGANRVEEIKNGDSPSITEFYKAKDCL